MADLQDTLGAILSNPQMMQQIMSMAQAFGQSSGQKQEPPPAAPPVAPPAAVPALSGMPDTAMLQNIYSMAQQSGIDPQQKALLKALEPYLTVQRIAKLERAMRAAKLTSLATSLLGNTGRTLSSGR
jgi:hypothetical protein